MYFDSHCHLTSEALEPYFISVVARAQAAGVSRMLNIADDLDSARAAIEQARFAPTQDVAVWATAGIHPQKALKFDAVSVEYLRALARQPEVVAIGEIGLDFVYDETHPHFPGATRAMQEEVFRAQMEVARELDLPVVIHNREADEALLRVVAEYPGIRGVFHCFASPPAVARQVLDLGYHLGFTGMITFKNAESVREVAHLCPLDRILIETDAPYLAPVPFRGKTNEPSYVPRVAETLAGIHGKSYEEIARITTANAVSLFGVR